MGCSAMGVMSGITPDVILYHRQCMSYLRSHLIPGFAVVAVVTAEPAPNAGTVEGMPVAVPAEG